MKPYKTDKYGLVSVQGEVAAGIAELQRLSYLHGKRQGMAEHAGGDHAAVVEMLRNTLKTVDERMQSLGYAEGGFSRNLIAKALAESCITPTPVAGANAVDGRCDDPAEPATAGDGERDDEMLREVLWCVIGYCDRCPGCEAKSHHKPDRHDKDCVIRKAMEHLEAKR